MTTASAPIVHIHASAVDTGRAAGRAAGRLLRATVAARGAARVMFASAPSQEAMLDELARQPVQWSAVHAFHMDEYIGLAPDHPQSFGEWLAQRLPPELASLERIMPHDDPEAEIRRYAALLSAPLDLVCLGIGANGHLAFNEPGSSFAATERVRRVELTPASRQQQVDDRCFANLNDVPTAALTVTIPTILQAGALVCTVLGRHKAAAVQAALTGPVDERCPASILQTREDAQIFVDEAAAGDEPALTGRGVGIA